jgi:four helix bundle protein
MSVKKSIIKDRSFAFAVRVIRLFQYLTETKKEYVLSKQLLRSGTAIGALVREAQKTSFINWVLLKKNVTKPYIGLNY